MINDETRMMGNVVGHHGGRGPLVVTQGYTNQTLTICFHRLYIIRFFGRQQWAGCGMTLFKIMH